MNADMKEAFYRTFTDDPVNWIKWCVVLAVLVLGYVLAIPLYRKVHYRLSWDRKRDIAISRGHVIKSKLIERYPLGQEAANYDWYATYKYTLDGEEKEYKAYFKEPTRPPAILELYYLENPRKLFPWGEYHYENHKAIILIPVIALPWLLGLAAIVILRIEIPGL